MCTLNPLVSPSGPYLVFASPANVQLPLSNIKMSLTGGKKKKNHKQKKSVRCKSIPQHWS